MVPDGRKVAFHIPDSPVNVALAVQQFRHRCQFLVSLLGSLWVGSSILLVSGVQAATLRSG